ncbi:MAG: disulfide bond formation protein B [Legionellales bacterium]|nr:disulfide bond formation protein B [Legionellales bacterium]
MDVSRKQFAWLQLFFLFFMLGSSFFFEYIVKLTPCALCLVQRCFILLLILLAFVSLWYIGRGAKVRGLRICSFIVCVLGLLVAWRHLWLQQNAALVTNAACLPDISFMLKMMPLPQVIMQLFSHGGSECSKIKWEFLGLTMPAWVAISYITYMLSLLVAKRYDN